MHEIGKAFDDARARRHPTEYMASTPGLQLEENINTPMPDVHEEDKGGVEMGGGGRLLLNTCRIQTEIYYASQHCREEATFWGFASQAAFYIDDDRC